MKILIIGAGSIGKRHFKNLLKIGVKDIAICDPARNRLKEIIQVKKVPVYQNIKAAFKKEKPTVVFICAPTKDHVAFTNMALEYGADIFIEKPLSYNLAGVETLIKKVAKKRKIAMVACNYRFYRGFQKLRRLLKSGKYGRPLLSCIRVGYYLPAVRKNVNFRENYAAQKKGGGVILDSGSHVTDYLIDLFGEIEKNTSLIGKSNLLKIQSEEIASLIFRHKNGILSTISLDYVSRKPVHRLEVITSQGSFILDFRNDSLVFETEKQKRKIYQGNGDMNTMFIEEIKHFLNCVKKRSKPLQNLSDGKRILKVLFNVKS